MTTPALQLLLRRGTGLVLLSSRGEFLGRLSGDAPKHVALRRLQYARADDPALALALGKAMVEGKIRNCRTMCMRLLREERVVEPALARLDDALADLAAAGSMAVLMGVEGAAARAYFEILRRQIRPPWTFERRARRPPPDPVNTVLSAGYTLLQENCQAALETVALDPACGFLHGEAYGRPALALDLMEEFRPLIVDSIMLRLFNTGMLGLDDFEADADGGVYLTRSGWRTLSRAFTRRLETRIRIPTVARSLTYRKVLEVQARALRAVIEGEAEVYRPFLTR